LEIFPYQNNRCELKLLLLLLLLLLPSSSSSSSSSSLLLLSKSTADIKYSKTVNYQSLCAGEKRGQTQRTKQGKKSENMKAESFKK